MRKNIRHRGLDVHAATLPSLRLSERTPRVGFVDRTYLRAMDTSDFGLLLSLDALLQEGSVTGAAKRVGLSTPAMSHALA